MERVNRPTIRKIIVIFADRPENNSHLEYIHEEESVKLICYLRKLFIKRIVGEILSEKNDMIKKLSILITNGNNEQL